MSISLYTVVLDKEGLIHDLLSRSFLLAHGDCDNLHHYPFGPSSLCMLLYNHHSTSPFGGHRAILQLGGRFDVQ